jgi:HEAT repeat protein
MIKRVQITLAVLLVALVSGIAWQALRERQPVYQGKRLSSWLKVYRLGWMIHTTLNADEAVRQVGTNALPTLLRMLRAKDSALKVKLMELAKRQHIIKIEYTTAQELNYRAACAFRALGVEAQSAVPALIEIANRNISPASQCRAIESLGSIGPSAKEAVPSLLGWATNADSEVRDHAITALVEIHAEPYRVCALLINALHDPSPVVQINALVALANFGPNAKLAVPALVEFLNAHDDATSRSLRSLTANALKAIDPEAAAKAGVK